MRMSCISLVRTVLSVVLVYEGWVSVTSSDWRCTPRSLSYSACLCAVVRVFGRILRHECVCVCARARACTCVCRIVCIILRSQWLLILRAAL